jgi:hypothetical protein
MMIALEKRILLATAMEPLMDENNESNFKKKMSLVSHPSSTALLIWEAIRTRVYGCSWLWYGVPQDPYHWRSTSAYKNQQSP